MESDLDKVENHDKEGVLDRRFYAARLYACDLDENFVHLSIAKGNGMGKLNRKDIDSLIDIIKEIADKMDQCKI